MSLKTLFSWFLISTFQNSLLPGTEFTEFLSKSLKATKFTLNKKIVSVVYCLNKGKDMSTNEMYDLIIIGGGPAGIAAAIYAARGAISCLLIDKSVLGGQLNWTMDIENYPGFPSITGYELIEVFEKQVKKFDIELALMQEISEIKLLGDIKEVVTSERTYKSKAIIICTGSNPKKIKVKGENEFIGRGVSYCAVCDAMFFKNKNVSVIGGGNSAVEEAIYLSKFANKVTIIHRRDELRADKSYQTKAMANPKIDFIWDTTVEEICGSEKSVNKLILKNLKTKEISEFETDGVFPFIGLSPNVELFRKYITLDENDNIICNSDMSTNIPGVYAAGDVRNSPLRQIVVSASDGAIAATSAIKYIDSLLNRNTMVV